MSDLGQKLRLAYYHSSDGPRIMVFGPIETEFGELQKLFTQLSRNIDMSCDLEHQPFIAAFGGVKVRLRSTGSMFAPKKELSQGFKKVVAVPPPAFQWQRTQEGWDYLAELIDPLVTNSLPGHHYLTRYPDEDAIVVVSKGEYSDEVLAT